jgi:PAS domain S-box-containing protein
MLKKERTLTSVDIIVSQSDLDGFIIYANPIFYKIAGYSYGKLIGENHNIIRHPDMPKAVFQLLWKQLKKRKSVYCFIKNKSKDNRYYWVFAYIRPSVNKDGSVRNYISTRRAMSNKAKAIIEPLYKQLLSIEQSNGVDTSETLLQEFMEQHRYHEQSDNEILHNIQY